MKGVAMVVVLAPDEAAGRARALAAAAGIGAAAGLMGAGAMVATEKLEQAITARPSSYVPGRALLSLVGQSPSQEKRHPAANRLMHYGTGAAVGALRGVWSATGIRGLRADAWHTVMRLGIDQTLENAAGEGAPPASWPMRERAVDLAHKAVYSFLTGLVTDTAIAPTLARSRGVVSH
jgi:hypothetical protein